MHRVDHPTATPDNLFTDGDPGLGIAPTVVPADSMNALQEEIANVIEGAGIGLQKGNNSQLAEVIGIRPLNYLTNGDFALWQRDPDRSISLLHSDGEVYACDRWRFSAGSGGVGAATFTGLDFAVGVEAGLPLVAGEPLTYLKWNQTVIPFSPARVAQRLEGVRTLAGEDVTVSFYARLVSGSISQARLQLTQHFGTGGSPSADVVKTSSNVSFTGSWARYSFSVKLDSTSGKTIGTDGNDYLEFAFDFDSGASVWQVDLTLVQLEIGKNAGSYQAKSRAQTLAEAERYYQKSYDVDVAPGTATGVGVASAHEGGTNAQGLRTRLRRDMRAAPAITWYSPSGSLGQIQWNSADRTVTQTLDIGRSSTGQPVIGATQPDSPVLGHWTADAEL